MNFTDLFSVFMVALISNNIVLSGFLGICSYLGVSKKTSSAVGMGIALTFVVMMSTLICYLLDMLLVKLDITYMRTVCFILVIASLVQFVEMVVKKFVPSLYKSLGVYLPLITTNCIVLYVCRSIIAPIKPFETVNFLVSFVFCLGTALGYFLVMVIFSSIREKLNFAPVPKGFQGVAIALITTAIMALTFVGFAGLF